MVVKCFRPAEEYSWAQLDAITAKAEGFGAWPFAGLTWLRAQGFDVRNIELMDNRRFAREGRSYLVEFFGAEFVGASRLPPDLSPDQAAAASFVDTVRCETRIPDLDDLRPPRRRLPRDLQREFAKPQRARGLHGAFRRRDEL